MQKWTVQGHKPNLDQQKGGCKNGLFYHYKPTLETWLTFKCGLYQFSEKKNAIIIGPILYHFPEL